MNKNPVEHIVQQYLIENQGQPLKKLNKKLIFQSAEYKIPGGRIDIFCHEKSWKKKLPIAIELKALDYNTSHAIGQLTKYLNFVEKQKGKVYFLAPKIKKEIYTQLKDYYKKDKLFFYEYEVIPYQGFEFKEMSPRQLKDDRKIKWMDDILKEEIQANQISTVLNLKNAKSVRTAFELLNLFYSSNKTINPNLILSTKSKRKAAAKVGSKIISTYSNTKTLRFAAKILDAYAKI